MAPRRIQLPTSLLVLVLLTLAALALRLLALGSKSLLTDEGSSYYFSQLPVATILWGLCDPHPPGYYLLLRAVAVLGASEWWLRLPSALAGALAVPLTWLVARQAIRPVASPNAAWADRAALLAAGLVAFAPLHIWYSQEARPYALLSALALLMVWVGLRWWLRPSLGNAGLFLLFGWLALFAEYGALVVWFGLSLFLTSGWPWRKEPENQQIPGSADQQSERPTARMNLKGKGSRWLAIQVVLLAPLAGWWLTSEQRAVWAGPSYQAVFLAVQAQGLGVELTPDQARRLIALGLVVAVAAGIVIALAVRRSPRVRSWISSPLVAWFLLGLVLVLAVAGAVPRLYTVKRHLTMLVPFVSIAAAWAWTYQWRSETSRNTWPRLVIGGTLAVLLLLSLVTVIAIPKPPWRSATAELALVVQAGDSVWVDEMDAPVFDYYWGEHAPWQALVATDLAALEAVPGGQRIWLISTVTPYRDLNQTLPTSFSRQRTASRQLDWPGIAARAYDTNQFAPNEETTSTPSKALLWGLDLLSPLQTSCR